MRKKIAIALAVLLGILALYLLAWPVPIEPAAWQAPPNPGYTGVFAQNKRLQGVELLPIGDQHGPEEVVLDSQGYIYASTRQGWIVRLEPDGSQPQKWVNTGGLPLGLVFDKQSNLIVADAIRGLLKITPAGELIELTSEADGIAIRYANNADVAADGRIYFSDSSRFNPASFGGTYSASLLDIMEHGGHGRLLAYDPTNGKTTVLVKGLQFPNGVAVSLDQTFVLVNETGAYRILRYWIAGPQAGQTEPFIEALPGFLDNLTTSKEGRYWAAIIAPRNALLDKLADKPWLRKVIQRLPAFLRPQAASYGHVIALNDEGKIVLDLQNPEGVYPLNTSVTESDDYLYLGSLSAAGIGRLAKAKIGL